MASQMRVTDDKFNVTRAPAHIEVSNSDSDGRSFPPPGASWHPTFSLSFDAPTTSAFAKLRVDFSPKSPPRTAIPLFAFIPPERIVSLSADDAEIPESARPELRTSLTKLTFSLSQPVTIISPPTPLVPKNKASGDTLEMLHYIASATTFSIYLPGKFLPSKRVALFCRMVRDGGVQSLTSESNISHLYNGKGGKAYEAGAFDPFGTEAAPAESPPSYDELALSPPPEHKSKQPWMSVPPIAADPGAVVPPYPGRSSKRRRTAASSSKPADQHVSREAMEDMCRQIVNDMKADLRKELRQELHDEMQEEFRTELSRELKDLKKQIMEGIDKRLDERDQVLRGEIQEEISDVREYVLDNRDDCLDDAGEIVDWKIDEQLTGIKDELQTFVDEELKNVEDRIKDDICSSSLSLNFN